MAIDKYISFYEGKENTINNGRNLANKAGKISITTDLGNIYYDITEGFAVKRILLGAGRKTINGGEIFNDYINNTASGQYTHTEGSYNTNTANYGHVEGYKNNLSGLYGHIEGVENTASGWYVHVEGYKNDAQGNYSHIEGWSNIGIGSVVHIEGMGNYSSGNYTHTEGYSNKTFGDYSHSQGDNNNALGLSSHAQGSHTYAYSNYSHTEGLNTKAGHCALKVLSVEKINSTQIEIVLDKDIASQLKDQNINFEGACHIYNAFKVTTIIDHDTIGVMLRDDVNSTALLGQWDTLLKTSFNNDNPLYVWAENVLLLANNPSVYPAHAEGEESSAFGRSSHAQGYRTIALGAFSHTQGYQTYASSVGDHAEGINSKTSGSGACHAEGDNTEASYYASHSQGQNTKALALASHAGGRGSVAQHNYSMASGLYAFTGRDSQFVSGEYNEVISNALCVIGNGSSESKRSNAFVVLEDGTIWSPTMFKVGGANCNSGDAEELATKNFVISQSQSAGGMAVYNTYDDMKAVSGTDTMLYRVLEGNALYLWNSETEDYEPMTVSGGSGGGTVNVIKTFTVSPSVALIGSIINTVTLKWSLGAIPTTLKINDNEIDVNLTSQEYVDLTLRENQSWTLSAVKDDVISDKTATLTFGNNIYYGSSTLTDLSKMIQILSGMQATISNSVNRTITVSVGADAYLYYMFPSRLATECDFSVGGFSGGFEKVGTSIIANSVGYEEEYVIYRSDNHSLGTTKVTITKLI